MMICAAAIQTLVLACATPTPAEVFERYESLIESIQSMECDAQVEKSGEGEVGRFQIHYCRTPQGEKLIGRKPGGEGFSAVRVGNLVKSIYPAQLPNGVANGHLGQISQHSGHSIGSPDPWSLMEFRGFQHLYGVQKRQTRLGSLTPYQSDQSSDGVITVRRADQGREWVDSYAPAYNYLRTSSTITYGTKDVGWTTSKIFAGVREVTPGIYLPNEVRLEIKDNPTGRVRSRSITKFSAMTVNGRVEAGALAFRFPPNITVDDLIRRVRYVTGPDGEPLGKPEPLPVPAKP